MKEDDCDPGGAAAARPSAARTAQAIHPMMRALWQPRLIEAIDCIADQEAQTAPKGAVRSRPRSAGETEIAGVTLHGKADRIDRLADGGLAIVDYKTGKPPAQKAVDDGYSLQLGLLGLIARAGGFRDVGGRPEAYRILVAGQGPRQRFGKRGAARTRAGRRGIPRPCRSPFPRTPRANG